MKQFSFLALAVLLMFQGCAQSRTTPPANRPATNDLKVGGYCEGCEAIYESPIPFNELGPADTLSDYAETGPKLELSGTVYQQDGKTPAADVVLYFYHTNQQGIYPVKGDEKGFDKQHGYLRGWVKTDSRGSYVLYTQLPAAYPSRNNPAHIHVTVKEPGKSEYWIDDVLFAGDPLIPNVINTGHHPRGGNGIVELRSREGQYYAIRDITLGLHIENYPKARAKTLSSGLAIGANCPAFDPLHLSGADKGSHACPMCKYGYGQGVMIWFNHSNLDQMAGFVQQLEKAMRSKGEKKMRVFMIYMNPLYREHNAEANRLMQQKIKGWCDSLQLEKLAMTWIPSPVDKETAQLYKIDPRAFNTVLLYKKRTIAAKWVNMDYTDENIGKILQLL